MRWLDRDIHAMMKSRRACSLGEAQGGQDMLDWLLNQIEARPEAFGAAIAWLAAPGLYAVYRQAMRRGYFKTRIHGLVRMNEQPVRFRRYGLLTLALVFVAVAAALYLTALSIRRG